MICETQEVGQGSARVQLAGGRLAGDCPAGRGIRNDGSCRRTHCSDETVLAEGRVRQMATTNHERVGKALALLSEGLAPFVARECKAKYGDNWVQAVARIDTGLPSELAGKKVSPTDAQFLLKVDLGRVAAGVPERARPERAHLRQRAARRPQPLGSSGRVLNR